MKLPIIYITGANGFIGQNLVTYLAAKDYTVCALLRAGSIPSFALANNIRILYGDLTDYDSLRRTIPKGAIVINLAVNGYHKTLSYLVNVEGVDNLVRASKIRKVARFIQISSQATKIEVKGVYARTKNESDRIVKESGLPYVILKPSLVYGGGEKGLFNKIRLMVRRLPFIPVFGDGRTKIYPIEVHDFSALIEKVMNDTQLGKDVFDVGCERPITYNDLYRAVAGDAINLVHIPAWIGLLLARMMAVMKNPPFYQDNVLGSTQTTNCRPQSLLKRYHYRPVSFAQGVQQILSPKRIRVAMVGLGKMGTLHLTILNTFPQVEIVALVDTNKRLFQTIKSMGIEGNFYLSLGEAFAHEKIDVVYIVTPTFTHLPLLKEALAHGAHVFMEKPAVVSGDEVKEVSRLKFTQVVHVGYTLLYSSVYEQVARMLLEKKYGGVVSFRGKFEHGEVFGPKKGWMFNKRLSGGGVLMNPGPHFFSLLTYFFGSPRQISGTIKCKYVQNLDDEAQLVLDYGKFRGEVSLSWSVRGRSIARNWFEIKCQQATITTDGENITIKPKHGRTMTLTAERLAKRASQEIFDLNPRANGAAYFREDQAFLRAVEGEEQVSVNTLAFAADVEKTIFECYKKAKVLS